MKKFWIVEYVDVSAPKAERSVICFDKSDARHRALRRESIVHFVGLDEFVGRGFCDSLRNTHTFDFALGDE